MSQASCLVIARVRGDEQERVDQLARWLKGSGTHIPHLRRHEESGTLLGEILVAPDDGGTGSPSTVTVEEQGDRMRVRTGAGAPTMLYRAEGAHGVAWSTHATAASLLAHGRVDVDWEQAAVLLASGAPLGTDTHLRGVVACAPASEIVIDGEGWSERTWLSREERWALVEAGEAYERAEAALLDETQARLGREPHVWVALTGGRDSPVMAAALRRCDIPFRTFTWGEAEWPDVQAAAERAAQFGTDHVATGIEWLDDEDAVATLRKEARWAEGLAPAGGWGRPRWPEPMSAIATGAGVEIARCYYYSWCVREWRRPGPAALTDVLGPPRKLADADPGAVALVRARVERWFADTQEIVPGWEALDVFYAEERMGRWGRARLPRIAAAWVAPVVTPEVTRAMISMPLEDRLEMVFLRRFIAASGADIALPPMQVQRPGGPAVLRRALTGTRRRLRPASPERWFLADVWRGRDALREEVRSALDDPDAEALLGSGFTAEMRRGFDAGERRATELVLALSGLVAYSRSLVELNP